MTVLDDGSMYRPIWLNKYVNTLPLWRRILANYFERYKITKKEYDEWFIKNSDKLLHI